jgi:hypothetical protein
MLESNTRKRRKTKTMSRRDGNPRFNLSKVIDEYKESKDRENALKKANTAMNESIKNYMSENDMDEASSDMYTAVLSSTTKESLNDDLAIEIIKENLGGALLSSVIKQKEYIDEDALEKLVYNGDFDISKLEKAKITKVTKTLRIKKKN